MKDNRITLIQEIKKLRAERNILEEKLLGMKSILEGSLIQRYILCGDPNCKCASGKPHGPYYYLSKKVRGETKLIYLSNKEELKELAQNYRLFQRSLTSIRRLNRQIEKSFALLRRQLVHLHPPKSG